MTVSALVSRAGFDPARLRFAVPTAFAACLAILLAWLLGLEHPQWSGMTVWAASQPMRGHLLEKSLFRLAGTISGTAAGAVLVLVSAGHPATLVAGLAVWVGLCAGIGNVQRGFVSYGTMLAGYSAGIVSLLGTAHADRIFALAADRLLTVLTGVVVALAVGWFTAPPQTADDLAARVRRLSARVLRDLAACLRGERAGMQAAEQRAILSDMAAIDETLDLHEAGSLNARRMVGRIRTLLPAEMSVLLWLRRAPSMSTDTEAAELLLESADALEAGGIPAGLMQAMQSAAHVSTAHPAVHDAIARLGSALRGQFNPDGPATVLEPLPHGLHRDWVGAYQAMIRAACTILFTGALWLLSGWSGGAFMLLGTAIMISLFSTFENPAKMMRFVFLGQALGAAAALTCRLLLWPLAGSQFHLVVMMLPFVLFGALVLAHRRSMTSGFDYNLAMLLLLQPAWPRADGLGNALAMAAAVLAGPAIALLAYRLIYPVNALKRLDTLVRMMVGELRDMAASGDAPEQRPVWRARHYHRVLRLVRSAEKIGKGAPVIDGSLAVLEMGNAILVMRALVRQPGVPPRTVRCLTLALRRMRNLGHAPDREYRALLTAARQLSRQGCIEAGAVTAAADNLFGNREFFRRAAASGQTSRLADRTIGLLERWRQRLMGSESMARS